MVSIQRKPCVITSAFINEYYINTGAINAARRQNNAITIILEDNLQCVVLINLPANKLNISITYCYNVYLFSDKVEITGWFRANNDLGFLDWCSRSNIKLYQHTRTHLNDLIILVTFLITRPVFQ